MREVELKVPDVDPREIRERLRRAGARKIGGPTLYREIFFDFPLDDKKGRYSSFRLRQEGNVALLNVKRRIPGKRYKMRRELEVMVSDFAKTRRLLEMIGFRVFRTREKYREEFVWRNVKIEIDRYPRMRPYLEAEATDPRALEDFFRALRIPRKNATTLTATELIVKKGLDPDRLFFSDRPARSAQSA